MNRSSDLKLNCSHVMQNKQLHKNLDNLKVVKRYN